MNNQPAVQFGFSLLESLIALVILSVALIGMGAMFAKSLGVSHGSYMRSLASIQAMDMAERIRANVSLDHESLSYQRGEITDGEITENGCEAVTADLNCLDNSCTPQESVEADLSQWCSNNDDLFGDLFSGAAIEHELVTDEAGTGVDAHYYTIGIEWSER